MLETILKIMVLIFLGSITFLVVCVGLFILRDNRREK